MERATNGNTMMLPLLLQVGAIKMAPTHVAIPMGAIFDPGSIVEQNEASFCSTMEPGSNIAPMGIAT